MEDKPVDEKTAAEKRFNIWINQFYWQRLNAKYGSPVKQKGKKIRNRKGINR